MAFGDQVHCFDGIEERPVLGSVAAQAHDGKHAETEGFPVDIHAIPADDAGFFHAAHAFGRSRRGEADLPAELGVGDAGVPFEN